MFFLLACAGYRTYPMLQLRAPGPPLEPTGITVLQDQRLVIVAEGEATQLWSPFPDLPLGSGGVLERLPLQDGRLDCADRRPACESRRFRGQVRLRPEPVRWLPRERGLTVPFDIQDLATFGPGRILGVTGFSTVGRKSAWRKDYVARPRRQTERLFVLERSAEGWTEVALPEVERLRDSLSDWGRSNCREDLLVEGLAYDPGTSTAWVGLSRCNGPAARVLAYDLAAARLGLAGGLEEVADGVEGRALGPAEGLTGLSWGAGRLWALTSWDSWGYEVEPAFGGQLHEVREGRLVPVDLPGRFLDRPSALAVLADEVSTPFSELDALVLFDNDDDAGNANRPNATLLRAKTPRPEAGRFVQLLGLDRSPDASSLGMNGFDLRWYARDHRLSQLAMLLGRDHAGEPGAWTRAVGGRWQIQVGASMGRWAGALGLGKRLGHNKQAVAFTDFSATSLRFSGYRARLSVIPRDRERQNPSIATLLGRVQPAYRVQATLPTPGSPDSALILQGVEIDTSSRSDEGICVAALELGVDWADAAHEAVALQATLIGGLCNDFDNRGPAYSHGRTTTPDGGVEVILHFAVVDGAPAEAWRAEVADRRLPAPAGGDPVKLTDDALARAHLHCVELGEGLRILPRQRAAPPAEWLDLAGQLEGRPRGPTALRAFALALDPVGFAPEGRALTEAEALARNNYIYRYLLRAFATEGGLLLEGGLSHGIHKAGLMRDNARPSATLVRAAGTSFPDLQGAVAWDMLSADRRLDPNLLPEDGFIRRAQGQPHSPGATCSASW